MFSLILHFLLPPPRRTFIVRCRSREPSLGAAMPYMAEWSETCKNREKHLIFTIAPQLPPPLLYVAQQARGIARFHSSVSAKLVERANVYVLYGVTWKKVARMPQDSKRSQADKTAAGLSWRVVKAIVINDSRQLAMHCTRSVRSLAPPP